MSDTSCSVTIGSETVSFSFTPNDVTDGATINGFIIVSGSQSTNDRIYIRDGQARTGTIDVPNSVECGENYTITICSVIPM